MNRFARRALSFFSALSLLLFIAVAVLWLRSYGVTDQLLWRRTTGYYHVRSAPGHLVIEMNISDWSQAPAEFYGLKYANESPPTSVASSQLSGLSVGPRDILSHGHWHGFWWFRWTSANRSAAIAAGGVPLWSVVSLAAILPLAWLVAKVRSRARHREGFCPSCGYDLRATPERCPECGRVQKK
jgi:hypothetical protein